MGDHGAAAVIGVDFNEAVDEAFASSRHLLNVHIVQANIFELPLKQHAFDVVWSNGVIHHTPDARAAHGALTKFVKGGGVMYVWVYPKRFNPFRFVKDVLDVLRVTRLPEPILLRVSRAFAYLSLAPLWLYQTTRRVSVLRPRTRWGEQSVRPRTLRELQLTWFDALSPEYDSRHREDEVVGWFELCGFTDIRAIEEPKVGVRGIAPSDQLDKTTSKAGRRVLRAVAAPRAPDAAADEHSAALEHMTAKQGLRIEAGGVRPRGCTQRAVRSQQVL